MLFSTNMRVRDRATVGALSKLAALLLSFEKRLAKARHSQERGFFVQGNYLGVAHPTLNNICFD